MNEMAEVTIRVTFWADLGATDHKAVHSAVNEMIAKIDNSRRLGVEYPYVYFWKANGFRTLDRKGERCRVVVRGKMNSCLLEFEKDRFRVVTSRNAIRKAGGLRRYSSIRVEQRCMGMGVSWEI